MKPSAYNSQAPSQVPSTPTNNPPTHQKHDIKTLKGKESHLNQSFILPSTSHILISQDEFLHQIDPQDVLIMVTRFDKKLFGTSMYVIEIHIEEQNVHLECQKPINEFQAFYEALRLKCKNLKFTKFPQQSNFAITKNVSDKRIRKFQKLFKQMITYATEYPEFRDTLMKMLYLFLLTKAKPIVYKKHEPSAEHNASPEVMGRKQDSQASPPDTHNLETSSNSKYDSNPHMDLAKLRTEFEPSNMLEIDRNAIPERPQSQEESLTFGRPRLSSMTFDEPNKDQYFDFQPQPNTSRTPRISDNFLSTASNSKNDDSQNFNSADQKLHLESLQPQIEEEQEPKIIRKESMIVQDKPIPQKLSLSSADDFKMAQQRTIQEQKISLRSKLKIPSRLLQIIKEDTLGFVIAKLPNKNSWKKYYVRYSNSQLLFCPSVKRHDFKNCYVIYKSFVRKTKVLVNDYDDKEPTEVDALMISHKYDENALFISLQEYVDMPEYTSEFGELMDEMYKFMVHKSIEAPENMILIDQTNRHPIGKLVVEVESIKYFPFFNNLFVRITCNPYVLQTRQILNATLEFQQKFFFPVHNHFNCLKIEIINQMNDGWFREHKKEQVIASFEIRIPDIDKEPFDDNGLIKLPISELIDPKKLGLKPVPETEHKIKRKQAYIMLKVKEMTRIDSMIIFNPNRDIIEDRKKNKGLTFKEISTVMTRTKLIICLLQYLQNIDRPIIYFDYPKFSFFVYLFLIYFTIIFNPNYLLTYIICYVIWLVAAYSEFWTKHITPHFENFFFREDQLNPLIPRNHLIRTHNQISQDNSMRQLREASDELKQIQMKYNIKDKNVFAKFKDFKKSSNVTLNYMEGICDFFEKTKNLIRWEDPRMTKYFFLVVLLLFFFVTFLPLKYIIIVWLTMKFNRGRFYHKRRVRNNEEVCRIELGNFMEDNKLPLLNYDERWEYILGTKMSMRTFEQKLTQYFQETLKIYLPKEIMKLCQTPKELVEYVGLTKEVLKLQENDRNESHFEKNPNIYRRGIAGYIYYYNFILNNVPSDIYRIKNPKLEVDFGQKKDLSKDPALASRKSVLIEGQTQQEQPYEGYRDSVFNAEQDMSSMSPPNKGH